MQRIELYYGIAEGNYLIGDLGGAERGIEQMLRIDPDYLPALRLKARVLLDAKRPEAALQAAERAIQIAPQALEHQLLKALILGQIERRKEAGLLIQQVLDAAPPESDDARAARQLQGLLLMAEGAWDQAAEAFSQIYQNDPDSARTSLQLQSEAYLEKARIALNNNEPDAAVASVDQAITVYAGQSGQESHQQATALRLLRARLLAQIGRFEAAIQDLQTLTGQQPENFEALITLASLYASVERWESLDTVIEPIARRPELRDVALYLEGRAALAKDRVGTARAKFEAAIEALPKEANQLRRTLYFYQGVCLDRLDREDEARSAILLALNAGFLPETRSEALLAARTLLRAGQPAEAVPILEAITLNRAEPGAEVWAMLGRAHLAAETPALALSALNESLRIAPAQADARALRGSLLRKIGDLEGARSDYSAALQLEPNNHAVRYALGLTQIQLGQIPEAEATLGQAAAQLKEPPGLHLLHALLAYTVDTHTRARSALQVYAEQVPKNQNPSAHYLRILLDSHPPAMRGNDYILRYFAGELSRKEAIDAAGMAESPEQARQQICTAAFWMAQYERSQGRTTESSELLEIALATGNPDLTEYQLAQWQLASQGNSE
jgi:tetratricopeptide (TPR) repeat protein